MNITEPQFVRHEVITLRAIDQKLDIVIGAVNSNAEFMKTKFAEADDRHYEFVARVSDAFTHVEQRFQAIDRKLDEINERFSTLKVEILTEVASMFGSMLQENNKVLLMSLREQL